MPESNSFKTMLEAALSARDNAHAPYSGFHVGAAIRLSDDSIWSGCNVENASYGATICAERFAVGTAVAARGAIAIEEVVVVAEGEKPWPPCGMCRQVLSEFCTDQTLVHTINLEGVVLSYRFSDLFPESFSSSFLERSE